MDSQKIFKTYVHTKKPVMLIQPMPVEIYEQIPIQFFVASTINFLRKYKLKLRDFSTQNIDQLNKVIYDYIKTNTTKNGDSERKVELK